MQSSTSMMAMTEYGFASEMGSGKVRWRAVQESSKSTVLVTGTGANVTALAVSSDSEWLALARRSGGGGGSSGSSSGPISILKLQGGSGTEISLPTTNSGLSGHIGALCLHKSASNTSGSSSKHSSSQYVLYAADSHGNLVCWLFKDEHSSIANPQVISSNLGSVSALYAHPQLDSVFVAIKDGTRAVKIALSSGRILEEFPQSASPPIRSLSVAMHISSLIVSSQHRHLAVYSVTDPKNVQFLSSDSPSLHVDVSPHTYHQQNEHDDSKETIQHILGVTELGEVAIWKVASKSNSNSNSAGNKQKPFQPQTRIKLDSASTKGHTIIHAAFSHSTRGTVIVAYGTAMKPHFTDLVYLEGEEEEHHSTHKNAKRTSTGKFISKLVISSSDKNALVNGSKDEQTQEQSNGKDVAATSSQQGTKSRKQNSDVSIAGPLDTPLPNPTFKASSDMMQVDPSSVSGDVTLQDETDVPFSQLIKKQQEKEDQQKKEKQQQTKNSGSKGGKQEEGGENSKLQMPRATSAVAALVAALSTNDKAQLNLILMKHDEQFVVSTLKQLPVSQVLNLLTELLASFSHKASVPVLTWVRHLLIIHQSYLASAPELINKLSGLYNTVDSRLKAFPELLKLSGRFDLLLAHLKDEDSNGELHGKRALQTYVEEDDENDEDGHHDEQDDDDLDLPDEDDDDSFGSDDDADSLSDDDDDEDSE